MSIEFKDEAKNEYSSILESLLSNAKTTVIKLTQYANVLFEIFSTFFGIDIDFIGVYENANSCISDKILLIGILEKKNWKKF